LGESKENPSTWIVYGVAAPVKDTAWEITSLEEDGLVTQRIRNKK